MAHHRFHQDRFAATVTPDAVGKPPDPPDDGPGGGGGGGGGGDCPVTVPPDRRPRTVVGL
ncbi:MAG: hypothetical protein EA388_08910 [Nitriliruptor sp.]|nr:MAG: hypothetical protein EA388_08910 [Nitriliruptor sp.]